MTSVAILVATLAVWRASHLLVAEDGPWDLLVRLRWVAEAIGLGRVAHCWDCASVWVAVPFALIVTTRWRELVLLVPALSGAAILLERVTNRDEAAAFFEGRGGT